MLEHVRLNYPDLLRGWFTSLLPADLEGGVFRVSAATRAHLAYLEEHCRRPFTEAAQAVTGRLVEVRFASDEPLAEERPLSFEREDGFLPLSDDYRFNAFITGPCNRLAHAASVAVAERLGTAYNPLFVHGGVGLGKTHLLQAICHEARARDPELNLVYISCETFANQFLEAVERGAMQQFRYRYRHADLLVIDDIQFLGERERSQEEFFHTFNTLHQSQRQIVLSADSPPSDLPSLQDRLVSRFNSGLVALVDKPCLETRIAIVRTKARLRCIDIPEDVATLIATKIDSNVRELEGALAKIDLLSQTRGGAIDMRLGMEALGVSPQRSAINVPEIISLVAKHYNVRNAELQGKKRTRSVAHPRQVCMYLARELSGLSFEEIGRYLGGRDHSTVLHAHRLIGSRRLTDAALDKDIEEFLATLKSGLR